MHAVDLRRAARLLHQYARELHRSHTVDQGEWPSDPVAGEAKRDHDQARHLATQLTLFARSGQRNA